MLGSFVAPTIKALDAASNHRVFYYEPENSLTPSPKTRQRISSLPHPIICENPLHLWLIPSASVSFDPLWLHLIVRILDLEI